MHITPHTIITTPPAIAKGLPPEDAITQTPPITPKTPPATLNQFTPPSIEHNSKLFKSTKLALIDIINSTPLNLI